MHCKPGLNFTMTCTFVYIIAGACTMLSVGHVWTESMWNQVIWLNNSINALEVSHITGHILFWQLVISIVTPKYLYHKPIYKCTVENVIYIRKLM